MNSHFYEFCNFWWFVLKPLLLKTGSYTSLSSCYQMETSSPYGHRGWKRKNSPCWTGCVLRSPRTSQVITWLAVMNSHYIPAPWHPATRAEVTSICQKKGWDKFTQEISNTNNLDQCLFPLLLVLKCQEILSQDFHPWMPWVQTSALYWQPEIAIMKSFPASKNTIHCQGKKIN